ncbi:hypothetical protein I552_3436 [Mycobacterium xenopi 3993]|nr:hypothetical protein I552_3436 [Mycobacterium xenopi 3993]
MGQLRSSDSERCSASWPFTIVLNTSVQLPKATGRPRQGSAVP